MSKISYVLIVRFRRHTIENETKNNKKPFYLLNIQQLNT